MAIVKDLISTSTLAALSDDATLRLVDCRFDLFDPDRGRSDYLAGHIPGAQYADMDRDLASEIGPTTGRHPLPDPESFRATLERWGIGDGSAVVAYDYGNGSLAARLWWMLRFWLGHENVAVLDGGIATWTAEGRPLESDVREPGRGRFSRQAEPSVVATTGEIVELVQRGAPPALLDARDPARFAGEREPVDVVAGHVPGAINMPLGGNLRDDGRFLSPAALRDRWQETVTGPGITMCGSGVTACHLILAAVVAGLPPPRLYVGSWSEWIRDPARPVAGPE